MTGLLAVDSGGARTSKQGQKNRRQVLMQANQGEDEPSTGS
jgi:hypothetical protein